MAGNLTVPNDNTIQNASDVEQIERILLFGLIPSTGVLLNSASIFILLKNKLLYSWTYTMILNLSIADLMFNSGFLIFQLPSIINRRYMFPYVVCRVGQFFIYTPSYVSLYSFMLAAIHRYLVIVRNRPNFAIFAFRPRMHSVVYFIIWIFASGFALFHVIPGTAESYYWPDYCNVMLASLEIVATILDNVSVTFPLLAIFAIYINVYIVVRRAGAKVSHKKGGIMKKGKEVKTAIVLFILYIAFAFTFVPSVIYLVSYKVVPPVAERQLLLFSMFGLVFVSSGNPILYAVLFKQIGNSYRNMICKHSQTRVVELEATSNTA